MKKQDRIVLHREKLYQEVWKTPVRQLAKKYGMSDVGLAKVCKRMNIPLPPRGYWAKHAYGHSPDKQSLPPAKKNGTAQVAIDKFAEELLQIARNRASGKKTSHQQRQNMHRLQSEMKDWEASHRIRAYIAATHAVGSGADPDKATFLAWAQRYADHLDPTKDFRIEGLEY